MADTQVYTSKQNGALWIAPSGPNSPIQYLPCHDLEDIAESRGSITLIQCINERGEYETVGATEAAPEPTTTTLGTYFGKTADWIETVKCPFPLYVMMRSCGKASVFENWERGMLLQVKKVTGRTISGLVRMSEDVPAMHTFDIEALPGVIDFFRLSSVEQSKAAGAGDVLSIRFLDDVACWDGCGENLDGCSVGYAATQAESGVTANVLVLPSDSSPAWTPTAADPFGVDEDIADIAIFKVGRNTTRILAVRGTTAVAAPLEVAYSDDAGATWTSVNVGSTNGEFAIKKGALYHNGKYQVFVVSNLGRIYESNDGGESWTVRENANITAGAYEAVHFVNSEVGYVVGNNGLVVRTLDGGKTWGETGSAAGSGDLHSVFALSESRVWVGGEDGELYYTTDGGATWTLKTLPGASANVNDIVFANPYVGYVANGTVLKFTVTGGYSWETVEDTANILSGPLVSVNYCSARKVYSASEEEIVLSTR